MAHYGISQCVGRRFAWVATASTPLFPTDTITSPHFYSLVLLFPPSTFNTHFSWRLMSIPLCLVSHFPVLASPVQLFISFSFLLKTLSSFRLTFRSIGVLYRTLSSHFPDYGLAQEGIFFFLPSLHCGVSLSRLRTTRF